MSKRTLLMIDVQRNMLLPPQPVPDAPAVGSSIARILEQARSSGAMVVHVRNNGSKDDPDAPGTTGWELVHDVAGNEAVIDKHTPNSFAGTDLGSLLADARELVIIGHAERVLRPRDITRRPGAGFRRPAAAGSPRYLRQRGAQRSGDSLRRRGGTRTGRSTNPRHRRHLLSQHPAISSLAIQTAEPKRNLGCVAHQAEPMRSASSGARHLPGDTQGTLSDSD